MTKKHNAIQVILFLYVLFIHIVLGVVLAKTDFITRVQEKFGIQVETPELPSHYHTMVVFQDRIDKNLPPDSIIFIGDSITQGLAVSAISPGAVNFGIGHDTSLGVLQRISSYDSLSRSKLVVIAVGINDLKRRQNDEILGNYQDIIDKIPDVVPVLFSAILPVDEVASNRPGLNKRIVELNRRLYEKCSNSDRLYFLDIGMLVANSTGNLVDQFHIGDGVHLSTMGYQVWIKNLREKISQIPHASQT